VSGHRDEGGLAPLEDLDDLGEVRERAGQPVDLVDDHDIDPPRFDVLEQALERRALEGTAGDTAVVVAVQHHDPALVFLTGDIGLAGLALVQGVSSEPVSADFPVIPGILAILGDMAEYLVESVHQISRLPTNSLRIGAGNLIGVSGNIRSGSGNCWISVRALHACVTCVLVPRSVALREQDSFARGRIW